MKKIIIFCILASAFINNTMFCMLLKQCRILQANKLNQIRHCDSRANFNYQEILKKLKKQQYNTEQQIKLVEDLIATQPEKLLDAETTISYSSIDRDIHYGNMNKDH